MSTGPGPRRRGGSRLTLRSLADETRWSVTFTDEAASMLEERIIALEEIVASRWPLRRIVLRRRLARQLRASVRGYRWVPGGFRGRRIEAAGVEFARTPASRRVTATVP